MSRGRSSRKPSSPILYYTVFPSAFGGIGLAATSRGLCQVSLNESRPSSFRKKIEIRYRRPVLRRDEPFKALVKNLKAYFSGRPVRFHAKLDLLEGTPFQRKVWRALRDIPHGQTRSYRAVARRIGRAKSFRAVGGACGNNPLPLLIPCHRVINSNGKPGGFTGGLHLKQRLLRLEAAGQTTGDWKPITQQKHF